MPTTGSKLKYFEDISCKKWHASSQNIGHLQEKDAVWWEQIQENLDWHWWTSPSLSVEGKLAFFSSSMEASLSSSIYFFNFLKLVCPKNGLARPLQHKTILSDLKLNFLGFIQCTYCLSLQTLVMVVNTSKIVHICHPCYEWQSSKSHNQWEKAKFALQFSF